MAGARTRTLAAVDAGVESAWKRLPDLVFWLFMLGTTAWLAWTGGADLKSRLIDGVGGSTHTAIFRVANAPSANVWTAPGLTYDGILGSGIALFEAAAVVFGLCLLRSRRLGRRVGGVMIVVAWAALWAGNAAAFAARSGGGATWLLAGAYAVPLMATIVVGMRSMGRRPRRTKRWWRGRLARPWRRAPQATAFPAPPAARVRVGEPRVEPKAPLPTKEAVTV